MKQILICQLAVCFFSLQSLSAAGDDWPHWRGVNRNDISGEPSGWTGKEWHSAKSKWEQNVGEGSTSPIVVGEQMFVMGWHDGEDTVSCLNALTGVENWKVSYKCPQYGRRATGDEGLYSGPTSTPEYDTATGLLYTLSCDGDLKCWNTKKQGESIWSVNLYETCTIHRRPKVGRSGQRDYGYTTAPLVHGDWVIVEVGAEEGTLMAFDKSSGKQVWRSEAKGSAGHTGGVVPINVEGISCVAAMTFQGLLVSRIDAGHEGTTLAQYEWITDFVNNIATPAVHDNFVLITSAYNHQAVCKLEITLQGARKIWEQPYPSKVCSPIIHNGHVYYAWQKMRCLDFETGEQKWEGGTFSDPGSCILTKDGRLIVWGGQGKLALVDSAEHSPSKYHELASTDHILSTDVWPHVVLANRHLYCKDRNGAITCFAVSGNPTNAR